MDKRPTDMEQESILKQKTDVLMFRRPEYIITVTILE